MHYSVAPVFCQEIAVAVAEKAAGSLTLGKRPGAAVPFRQFIRADRGLVIGQPEVLGPELRRDGDRQARPQRRVDRGLVDALRVQVDPDAPPAADAAVKDRPPQIVAALGYAAFAVDAEGDAGDVGTFLQQQGEGGAAVRRVGLGGESVDVVVRLGAVGPAIGMSPQSELEIQAAGRGFVADVPEHLKVPVALLVGQVGGADPVPRHRDQERVGKIEIRVAQAVGGIIAQPEREIETIEAMRRQQRQITSPKFPVIEPPTILKIAGEHPHHAAHRIGRMLDDRPGRTQGRR